MKHLQRQQFSFTKTSIEGSLKILSLKSNLILGQIIVSNLTNVHKLAE